MQLEKFDLLKYAENSLNYLTKLTDEKLDYLPYWLVKLADEPAHAKHCRVDDAEIAPSWSKALTLIRKVLDTDEGREQEAGFRKLMMENFREDGLSYSHDFPWEEVQYSNMHEACWVLDAMVYYYMDTRDPAVKAQAEKMIESINGLAVHKKGRFFWHGYYDQPYESSYIPFDNHFEDRGLDGTIWTGRSEEVTRNGGLVLGLVEFSELTGHEGAMKLAGAMANHIAFDSRKFGYEGHYIGHVHAAMWTVSGVLKYALVNDRPDLLAWSKSVYEYTKRFSTSFGWVPEYVNRKDPSMELCETCCIADMIRCALLLTEAGMDEYWEDVDRFTRNHLVRSQICTPPDLKVDSSIADTEDTTHCDIDKRVVGAFSAGTTLNYFPYDTTRATGGCCGATGANSIYYVWKEIMQMKEGKVVVNLLIDRDCEFASVESQLPKDGVASVTLKVDADVCIRIPETAGHQASVRLNGTSFPVVWDGSYICVESAKTGDVIEVSFHDPLRKTIERQGHTDHQVEWKGNTVLRMMPNHIYPGAKANRPLYALLPPVNYEPSRL